MSDYKNGLDVATADEISSAESRTAAPSAFGEIVAIKKPVGWSSFDVVAKIRKITGIKKVGHAGTLDPFATGVLIVGIGRQATKRLDEYQQLEKEYIGRIVLGTVTDTFDPTGKVISQKQVKIPSRETILEVLHEFLGEIDQLPPMFSAVKVDGMRLYKAARKGLTVERKPRRVMIKSLELLDLCENGFEMKVVCSKGTYIRTLAYDIGKALDTGAFLDSLVRTRIGDVDLNNAKSIDEFALWFGKIHNRGI